MKIFYLLSILMIFASCKCKKDLINEKSKLDAISETTKFQKTMTTFCPENGKCITEIFRNKELEVKSDEFGSVYYNQIDNPSTSIVKFSYDRNVPKGLHDGSYREEIIFEINNSDKELNLKNEDIQKTKMLFGRFCFCRGTTGNYKIIDGNLNLTQQKGEIMFQLEFKNNKVPQLLTSISETIKN